MLRQAVEVKAKVTALALFLKYGLPALVVSGAIFGLMFVILFSADSLFNSKQHPDSIGGGTVIGVSAEVLQYQGLVESLAAEYGVAEYSGVILAMMMQESGGRGNDPMQSSESLCGSIGCIQSPEASIEQGVKYFAQTLEKAEGDVRLAVQAYNFGLGFIPYALERGGYSKENAIDFSIKQYERVRHTGNYSCIRPESAATGACYGDISYVDAVFSYYNYEQGTIVAGGGSFVTPVNGMRMTSDFGYRTHPITGEQRMHNGIDFGCINYVTPINAVTDGHVVFSGSQGGYGNMVILKHAPDLYTAYAHNSSNTVKTGDQVRAGQQIGVCGSTGASTGPHLHLEFRSTQHGGHQDPKPFLGL
ncbi:lysozyme family protein [Alkalihalobacterium sp. APHAB7]|uniref:lysozyme family protein n=1 Tax=Alkalihalobacterium sp. APHAB7 TaxID=3402081 RepID=UPI003AACD0FE